MFNGTKHPTHADKWQVHSYKQHHSNPTEAVKEDASLLWRKSKIYFWWKILVLFSACGLKESLLSAFYAKVLLFYNILCWCTCRAHVTSFRFVDNITFFYQHLSSSLNAECRRPSTAVSMFRMAVNYCTVSSAYSYIKASATFYQNLWVNYLL